MVVTLGQTLQQLPQIGDSSTELGPFLPTPPDHPFVVMRPATPCAHSSSAWRRPNRLRPGGDIPPTGAICRNREGPGWARCGRVTSRRLLPVLCYVTLRLFSFVLLRCFGDVMCQYGCMSENTPPATEIEKLCTYPGCTRPRRPDPATGRPSRYCERADEGGPVHNRGTAWKARRTQRDDVPAQEDGLNAPVSMARATLEQRLVELPGRVADLRQYLDAVVLDLRAAGDVEAAGSEVEDAHREALAKVTEAERRAAAAERAARSAQATAQAAQEERDEADALTEEAAAETARIRDEAHSEIAHAQQQLAAAEAGFAARLAERDAEVEQARRDVAAARMEAASAAAVQEAAIAEAVRERDTAARLRQELDTARNDFELARKQLQAQIDSARHDLQAAAAEAATIRTALAEATAQAAAAERASDTARESLESMHTDLERVRAEARAEREALRATHAEQLAQYQRNADDRVSVLTEALTAAREMVRLMIPAANPDER